MEGKWNKVFCTSKEVLKLEEFKKINLDLKVSDPDEILLPKEQQLKDLLSLEFPNLEQLNFWFKVIHQIAYAFRFEWK